MGHSWQMQPLHKVFKANLFVELHDTQGGEHPGTSWRDDLRVSETDPLQHLGTGLGSAATKGITAHCQEETTALSGCNKHWTVF